ncbi:uncharacterized protein [Hemitrygon akajei]|uniref:uncharacterized protein n=1 Tax=Hemitrygon akajei TaxID=2704970 RepID=UPI003BFA2240
MGVIYACIKPRPEGLSDVERDDGTKSSDSEQRRFLDLDQFQGDPRAGATSPEDIAFDRNVSEPPGNVEQGAGGNATEMGGIYAYVKTQPEGMTNADGDHATKSCDSEQGHVLDPGQFQGDTHAGSTSREDIAFDRTVSEPSGNIKHGAGSKATEMGGVYACIKSQPGGLSDAEADHATKSSDSELTHDLDPDQFQGDPQAGATSREEIAFDRTISQPSGNFEHGAGVENMDFSSGSVKDRKIFDLNSAISAFLSSCEDQQLLRLTRFYKERLEQAIEEGVEGVGFMLMDEDHFTGPGYHSVTELAEKGNRSGASKLLMDLVMEKGSGARRVMWESFVKLHHHLPKLSRILNEILEHGDGQFAYMDTERRLSELPTHLKDVRRKHMEALREQTEKLRVNPILREKVKVFQLVDRYAELTVISAVRHRRLVEHELLARARGLEEFLDPFPHQITYLVINWVKKEFKRQSGNTRSEDGKRSLLNTLHYLFESQDHELAQATLGSVGILSFSGITLTPIDCRVLSHAFGLCDTIKHLDLYHCNIQCEGIQRLGPGLHKCQVLGLGMSKLGDQGVKLVSAALRNPECKIQKLGLDSVGLTDSGAEDLVSALSTNTSLTELNLSKNFLSDRSVPALRHLILNLGSLEWFGLWNNQFSRTGRKELRSLQELRHGLSVDP